MSSRGQVEQPFQVVTQKRPSGQARKVFNRDKPPTPRTQHATEDHNSTTTVSTGGSSGRKRQSGSHREGGGKHSSARSGGSAVQARAQHSELERDGEGGEGGGMGRGHTNRHSWDPETAMQYQHGGTAPKSAADKIERSQSARFDRVTDTNNRFERLNPDTEAPGEAPRSGGTRNRKRNSRSVSGSSSYRSRSPKRKSGTSHGGPASEKSAHRDKESASSTNCDLEWNSGPSTQSQSESDVFVNGGVSLAEDQQLSSSLTPAPLPDSQLSKLEVVTSVDKVSSGASAQGSVEGEGGDPGSSSTATSSAGVECGEGGEKKSECDDKTHKTKPRLSYTRAELLAMRHLPLSQKKPESLHGKFFRGGKWCADAWLALSNLPSDDKEELEEGETAEPASGKNLPKLKNPTTLSIIREHDAKTYGKVCLSPQRRSFGSGCSWKDMSSSSTSAAGGGKDGQTAPSAGNHRDFDGNTEGRRSSGSRSSFQSHSHSSHTPRVINHTPLRNQRGWKGEGGRGGERDGGKSYGGHRSREIEEEPEWMAFGPSDRSEVIELIGFEEHEKEREFLKEDEQLGVAVEDEVEGEGGSEGGKGAVSEEEGSTKMSEGSVGVEEGVVGVVRAVMREEEESKVVKEPENEFMLDGFDFSTSVSICQALESDEEEDERLSTQGRRGGVPLPSTVSNPHELSSALMKALRVGEEEAYLQGGHPVNALTLEEVHERENIHHHHHHHHHPSPSRTDTDQSAFNRLVAVLQSSGAIQDEPTRLPLPQKLPRPPVPLAMPHKTHDHGIMTGTRVGDGVRGAEPGGGSFGFMLEKEMRFDEDFSPSSTVSAHPSRVPTFHNSLRESHHHLAKMEVPSLVRESYGAPTKSLFQPPLPHSTHPHQAPPTTGRLSDKWVERSWIHPENQSMDYGGLQRPPVDPLGLPMMHHHHHHHHQSGRSTLNSRPPPNSWAIEMEQRRRMELQSMREREAARSMMMAGDAPLHTHHVPSKPNISLLPTAVMRQLHNSNPNHSLSDITSRASQSSADRLEPGDLSSRSVYSSGFGYPDMVGGGVSHSREYPYPTAAHMRVPPRPQHRPGIGVYTPPPQYIPIPHGMPSQQNPYLQ